MTALSSILTALSQEKVARFAADTALSRNNHGFSPVLNPQMRPLLRAQMFLRAG
jgi:hypothetical protein